ncbi:MAG: hypothetical protein UV54_C0055G0005 [Candidatus Beckwithbacteria bacterium GW2011_GWA2_43_10]|uniref:Phosphoglycerate mutase n=1 Tax=Candidatus Beckwithbacteria bacterium GW2011_GWA2_43_10 TaxID=1618369 RepID=A0A0G1BZF2_9BACT|nr:MAG: hypothetical protein UV54_C0055G0005 [Candidatus Beckwithbacteria bacterium GW2011_GWA2_43_10]
MPVFMVTFIKGLKIMHQPILPPYCSIYLVRHGETDNNRNDIIQGAKVDMILNKTGEQQAKEAAKRLKTVPFATAFSSDLVRAKQTAEIISLEHNLAVTTAKAIRERGFGDYEGRSVNQFREDLKDLLAEFETLSDEAKFNFDFPYGIENLNQAVTRLITFLREISVAYLGKTVLVVSHGALIRHFLIRIGFATFQQLQWVPGISLPIANLGHAVIDSDGIDFFVKDTYGINKQA